MEVPSQTRVPLVNRYAPPPGFYDEFLETPEAIRPVWQRLASLLESMGRTGLSRRVETLKRLIREYGVTYNVYSDDDARKSSDWAMDVVPFLLDGKELAVVEDALSQRFHLLDLVLEDCYGEQRLLEGGHLPPDLVMGNPGFLPACHGLLPRRFHHTQLYCADLARSPDGHWWVLSDRLDAASGLAYAIENRMLSHRVMPEGMRVSPIHSLQPFVSHYCETIEALAPHRRENPHVVLLTPGPLNETYYEHSFLARTLGYPLVEGADLTVRDSHVYLKTITGLQQVDVIIRRVDSDWSDPLELRADSLLGVPGLMQAVRSGNVAVANGIGSSLVQAPAFSAYLPGLCKLLLGEELKIPSVATWWCGEKDELDYVLEHLPSLVIKPAKDTRLSSAVFGETLTESQLATWRQRLKTRPHDWCGQEQVAKATTPSFDGEQLVPSHFLMRVYMIRYRGGYQLMPGGLLRASQADGSSLSMQVGAVSKDVWVTHDSEVPLTEMPGQEAGAVGPTIIIRRSAHSLPSRTADNLFWLGRYFERSECHARLVRALIMALMDEGSAYRGEACIRLFSVFTPDAQMARLTTVGQGQEQFIDLAKAESFLTEWFQGETESGGLRGHVGNVLRTAQGVRERLSTDAWHTMSQLEDLAATLPFVGRSPLSDRALQVMDSMLGLLSGISGLFMENMTRGSGWHFQDLGRRVERALHLSNLVYSTLTPPSRDPEPILWALLDVADSLITYRRRYFTSTHATPVLDLMMSDPMNPRSMAFQVERMRFLIGRLPHHSDSNVLHPIDKTALRLSSLLGLCEIEELNRLAEDGHRRQLASFLDDFARELEKLSEQLSARYFAITQRQEMVTSSAVQIPIQTTTPTAVGTPPPPAPAAAPSSQSQSQGSQSQS